MKKILLNKFMQAYPTFHKLTVLVAVSFVISDAFFAAKLEQLGAAVGVLSALGGGGYLGRLW